MIIRKVNIETDAEWILHIRNNEAVFKYFNNNSQVLIEEHIIWLWNYLKNEKNIFLVCEIDGVIVWYARKDDLSQNEFEISIAIDPLYQGKSIWRNLLEEMMKSSKKWEVISAEIYKWNIWSQKLFEKVWFTLYKEDDKKIYMNYKS